MRNYVRLFFIACFATTIICYAQEKSDPTFSLDDLIENAEVTEDPPISRELPWYITAVEKPASRIVFALCNAWDWVKTKSKRTVRLLWSPQEKEADNNEQKQSLTEKINQIPNTISNVDSYGEP